MPPAAKTPLLPLPEDTLILITRLDEVSDGNPLGPRVPFVAQIDGVQVAEGDLMARSWMGDETGRLVNVRWEPGHR